MKLKRVLIGVGSVVMLGACVNYPKNYTYSPTVVVKSEEGNNSPIILPNPFATNKSTANYNVNIPSYGRSQRYYQPEPSPLTAVVSRPPVAANYYYDSDTGANYEQPVEEMQLEAF